MLAPLALSFCFMFPPCVSSLCITAQEQLSPKIKGFALNFRMGFQSYILLPLTQMCAVPIATLFRGGLTHGLCLTLGEIIFTLNH